MPVFNDFPQWGLLTRKHRLKLDDKPPGDWKLPAADWKAWRDARTAEIAKFLWPEFVPGVGWKGDAVKHMLKLTKLDLDTMLVMQRKAALQQPIQSKGKSPNALLHEFWFGEEDVSVPFFCTQQNLYDTTIPAKTLGALEAEFRRCLDAKVGSSLFQWKDTFQRPRAYQMAHVLDMPGFSHEIAKSALHPALPSGHAIQGILVIGGVLEHVITTGLPQTDLTIDCLLQYAADIGDRRVMAGVHYPSDNIASWYLALLMADHLFVKHAAIKPQLWRAIQMSSVYQTVAPIAGYKPYLDKVREAAGRVAL